MSALGCGWVLLLGDKQRCEGKVDDWGKLINGPNAWIAAT